MLHYSRSGAILPHLCIQNELIKWQWISGVTSLLTWTTMQTQWWEVSDKTTPDKFSTIWGRYCWETSFQFENKSRWLYTGDIKKSHIQYWSGWSLNCLGREFQWRSASPVQGRAFHLNCQSFTQENLSKCFTRDKPLQYIWHKINYQPMMKVSMRQSFHEKGT